MLSQKLSDCICNEPLELKSQSGPKQTASACSCSVCESVSCFYIRNKKSTQPCSCNHQKVNVEYVKSITKELTEFNEKDNFTEIIDYNRSDGAILSDTKYYLQTSKVEETCEIQKKEIGSHNKDQLNKAKAELSAQIMNVPYEEFKCSLSKKHNKTESAQQRSNNDSPIYKINELVKPDILTRLKEIYEACSCKVCECITDKSLPIIKLLPNKSLPIIKLLPNKSLPDKQLCNCSPCDCSECIIAQKIKKLDPRPPSGCPCVRCDRKDCRGVVKKPTGVSACDCYPCDCSNCTDASAKSCTCKPCECAECTIYNRTRTPVLSTSAQKHLNQSTCRCKPCECANCTQFFRTMTANLIQDISKKYLHRYSENELYLNDLIEFNEDISEYDLNEYDQSERRYSIQRNNYDCDINRRFLNDQLIHTGYNNFNTIAMMAMYSTNYSKVELNNTKDCKCLGCECLICTTREKDIKNKISFNDIHHRNVIVTSHSKSCDCVACQCEFCSKAQDKLAHKLIRLKDNCSCSICDCIMCDNTAHSNDKDYIEITSQQEQGLSKDTSCTNIYPLKKGKLLAPTKFENNVYEPSCLKSQLYFSNNVFTPHIETITHLSNSVSTLPVYKKSTNFKKNEYSQYSIPNAECPVKDIFSNNYIKNNDLHIGNKVKYFYVPAKLNKTAKNDKSLEKYTTEIKTFDTNSTNCNEVNGTINNNPFNCFNGPKLVNVKDTTYQETNNLTSDYSILSIFKSTSESVIRESTPITKDNTVLNTNFKGVNLNLPDDLDLGNTKKHYRKQNIIISTKENNDIVVADRVDLKKDKNKKVKYKYTYNKVYRRLIRQTQISKRKKSLTRTKDKKSINHENNKKVNINENLQILVDDYNEKKLTLTINNKKTVDDFFSSEINMLNKIKNEVQGIQKDPMTKPWPILQKNFCMNCSEIRRNKGVCTIPDLELDVKKAVKFISHQHDNNENKVLVHGIFQLQRTQNVIYRYNDATTQTKAMTIQVDKETNCSIIGSTESLRNNMKYLLDLVLSRVVSMSKLNVLSSMFDTKERVSSNISKINSTESSCGGLKANIIELKRVSNHSLLVRWKVPRKTANIQGYELQVDGRSVQKIFSPTRCMAVLTCLPRCEKLLLTIRTLTTTLLSDHYPATTVVYRPRIK